MAGDGADIIARIIELYLLIPAAVFLLKRRCQF